MQRIYVKSDCLYCKVSFELLMVSLRHHCLKYAHNYIKHGREIWEAQMLGVPMQW